MSDLAFESSASETMNSKANGHKGAREAGSGMGPELTLGQHVRIMGTLEVEGDLRLEWHVEGEVHCRNLTVEPSGCVDGLAVAEKVEVIGAVQGEIFADRLRLKNNCSVEADIHHCHLVLEDGAYFEGRSRRHANTQSLIDHLQSGGTTK